MAGSRGSHGSEGSHGKQQGGQQGSKQGGQGSQRGEGSQSTQGSQGMQEYVDPVCGMNVQEGEFGGTSTYQGQTYHFCSQECQEKFDRSPQQFAKRTA